MCLSRVNCLMIVLVFAANVLVAPVFCLSSSVGHRQRVICPVAVWKNDTQPWALHSGIPPKHRLGWKCLPQHSTGRLEASFEHIYNHLWSAIPIPGERNVFFMVWNALQGFGPYCHCVVGRDDDSTSVHNSCPPNSVSDHQHKLGLNISCMWARYNQDCCKWHLE